VRNEADDTVGVVVVAIVVVVEDVEDVEDVVVGNGSDSHSCGPGGVGKSV
jgi:hypothetical protein